MSGRDGTYVPPSLHGDNDEDAYTRPLLLDQEESAVTASILQTPSRAVGDSSEPATGIVYGQPIHLPQADHMIQVPSLPDGLRLWKDLKLRMAAWFGVSLLTLFLFSPIIIVFLIVLFPVQLACVLGAIASGMYLFKCSGAALGNQVKFVAVIGKIVAGLDLFGLFFTVLILTASFCDQNDPGCGFMYTYVTFFALFLTAHSWLSYTIGTQARSIQVLLDPVSSGMVTLAHF